MSPSVGRSRLSRPGIVVFLALFLLLAYFLYRLFRPFFSILVWASVLTVIFHPLFREVVRVLRGRRAAAALITCLLILSLIVLPVWFLGIQITEQSLALYRTVQTDLDGETAARLQELQERAWVRKALDYTGRFFGNERPDLRTAMEQLVSTVSRFMVSRSPSLLRGIGDLLFGLLLMFISMFFLFRDGPVILNYLQSSNPLPVEWESDLIKRFKDVSYATFIGSILTAAIQGLAGGLMFWALGISSPLFWGALVAFVSLIPIIGAFVVWLPWTGYLVLMDEPGKAIAVLAIGGLGISSIDNILRPMILQGRTDLHPLLVFLSVLGGMQAFGFLGVLAGPMVVALFVSALNFYRTEFRESLEKKLEGLDSTERL